MKHCIIVKFKNDVPDKEAIVSDARKLFSCLEGKHGIRKVSVYRNCVDRTNRYDMMVAIEMDCDSLDAYDKSNEHMKWKSEFGCYIESKAIFDYED